MIRFQTKNGEEIFIAPEHVRRIEQSGNHENACYVDSIYVTESPEEVNRKILEYKLAMVNYGALADDWATEKNTEEIVTKLYIMDQWKQTLEKLAGLEDKP